MIVLDTSGLLAAIDRSQRKHEVCAQVIRQSSRPLLLSPFVLAELDYLLLTHVGQHAEMAFLKEVIRGAYHLESFSSTDVGLAVDVARRYAALTLGLADASIVVLAQRHDTNDVLTLDERHFRSIEVEPGKSLRLLPSDM